MNNNFAYGTWFHKLVQEYVSQKGNIAEVNIQKKINRSPDKLRARHETNNFLVSALAEFIRTVSHKSYNEVVLSRTKRADVVIALTDIKTFLVIEIKTSVQSLENIHEQFLNITVQTRKYSKAIKNITGFRTLQTIYLSRYGVWLLNENRAHVNKLTIIQNITDILN
jgi:hypothetical protein